MSEPNRWLQMIEADPTHSARYIQRFRDLANEGNDLHGEARLVDAMSQRGARILDAGCGPGRVGGELHQRGHQVVGVDLDPELIAAARADHPGPAWITADLSALDLTKERGEASYPSEFDTIVCAGNVMAFLAPDTRGEVLGRLRAHLAPAGRLVVGFGAGRDYDFADFRADARAAGLKTDLELGSWHLHPFTGESDFLVSVLTR